MEGHLLSAVRDCLLNILVATLHIWRPSPPFGTRGNVATGTYITWSLPKKDTNISYKIQDVFLKHVSIINVNTIKLQVPVSNGANVVPTS